MEYKTVIYEKDRTIARITLNQPEKLNVFDFPGQGGICDDFHAALTEAEDDDDVKVVIMKGAGRAFCAGHDLSKVGTVYGMGTGKEGERRPSQRIRLKVDRKTFYEGHLRVALFPKVTIAQVHGYCVGEGTMYVELCDLAIASEDAVFGHVEQRIAAVGSNFLPLIILTLGTKKAMELLLTGKRIDAREAERIGLVNKAVPRDKLEEEVNELASAISLLPRDGIALGKAHRQAAYDSMGVTAGFTQAWLFHSFMTNMRFEPDEYSLLKQRRDQGVRAAAHGEHDRFAGLDK
ncbi:MAG: enoyl-CoA hydratase/isomerase family protein [Chloroflexi bacterium]|nr:enoyl-CoA hydratase/isomerase family protein [Chloroflexota bacterium]